MLLQMLKLAQSRRLPCRSQVVSYISTGDVIGRRSNDARDPS